MLRNILGLLVIGYSAASSGADSMPPEYAAVRTAIEGKYPHVKVLDVSPTPIPGLLEIYLGDSVAYTDASGAHLLVGTLVRTRDGRDLSAESLSARNAIDFDSLPFQQAIVTVKGDGTRRLAVFSDPDCPFCEQLEKELESITNVTIYTFLYPLVNLHPDAARKAQVIWCSNDRADAWRGWMIGRALPTATSACGDYPVDTVLELGRKLKITGTPTLYLGDGQRIEGTLEAGELEKRLAGPAVKRSTSR